MNQKNLLNVTSKWGGLFLYGIFAATILILGLQFFEFIDWEWYWLVAPMWVPACFALAFLANVAVIAVLYCTAKGYLRDKKER